LRQYSPETLSIWRRGTYGKANAPFPYRHPRQFPGLDLAPIPK
jgi:hypothetical protein